MQQADVQCSFVGAQLLGPQAEGRTATQTLYPLFIGKQMKTLFWFMKWFLIDAAVLVAVFGLSWWYFASMVTEEYRAGVRTETGGDSIMIPVMGVVIVTAAVLLCANAVCFVLMRIRRRRTIPDSTRNAQSAPEDTRDEPTQNNGA
jgi:hypothetical protein